MTCANKVTLAVDIAYRKTTACATESSGIIMSWVGLRHGVNSSFKIHRRREKETSDGNRRTPEVM